MIFKYCFEYSDVWKKNIFQCHSNEHNYENDIISFYLNEIKYIGSNYITEIIDTLKNLDVKESDISSESWDVKIINNVVLFGSLYFPDEPEFTMPREKMLLLVQLWDVFIKFPAKSNNSIVINI